MTGTHGGVTSRIGTTGIVGVTEDDFELVGDGFELVDLPLVCVCGMTMMTV